MSAGSRKKEILSKKLGFSYNSKSPVLLTLGKPRNVEKLDPGVNLRISPIPNDLVDQTLPRRRLTHLCPNYTGSLTKTSKKKRSPSPKKKFLNRFYKGGAMLEKHLSPLRKALDSPLQNTGLKTYIDQYMNLLVSVKAQKGQISRLTQENLKLSTKIEALMKDHSATEDLQPSKGRPVCVPRLNFKSFSVQDFQDEFMNRAAEFSVSWRDAMNLNAS